MKKIILILLLFATTFARAQDVPNLLSQVNTQYSSLQSANIALKKSIDSLNAIIKLLRGSTVITTPPPVIVSSGKIAKLDFTDTQDHTTVVGWTNLDLANVSTTYSIGNGWSLIYSITTGIGHGEFKLTNTDVDFDNSVLNSEIYMNGANSNTIGINFAGLDATKTYTIKTISYGSGSGTTFNFGGNIQSGNPQSTVLKLTFTSIKPTPDGKITGVLSGVGYICIGGLIISEDSSTSTAPPINNQSNFGTLLPAEKLFTDVNLAYKSTTIANGSVSVIKDYLGNYPLNYVGIANPTITGIPPTPIDSLFLAFDNRPNSNYNSTTFTPVVQNYEIWLVSRNMPGQRFEAKLQGSPESDYLGDLDQGGIRLIFNNCTVLNSVIYDNYKIQIERIVVKPKEADYYVNGKFIGAITDFSAGGANTAQSILDNTTKKMNGIGAYTNSMDFDFGGLYFKAGLFSDSVANSTYAVLAKKWNVNSIPNQILLQDIGWNNVNGSYTATANIINIPNGIIVADISKWRFQWYWKDNATNYATQTLFATKQTVTSADFPSNWQSLDGFVIKCRIEPIDTNGNSWRYFSGLFQLPSSGSSI